MATAIHGNERPSLDEATEGAATHAQVGGDILQVPRVPTRGVLVGAVGLVV